MLADHPSAATLISRLILPANALKALFKSPIEVFDASKNIHNLPVQDGACQAHLIKLGMLLLEATGKALPRSFLFTKGLVAKLLIQRIGLLRLSHNAP